MKKSEGYRQVMEATASVRKVTDFAPRVAITLGSGLGDYADQIEVVSEVPYSEIAGFPVSTVQGHAGRLIFGYVSKVPVVAMKGRVHFYEGYTPVQVVTPVRLIRQLGAEILVLTNAAGGVNAAFDAGELMLITDHIALFAHNPLIGPNDDRFGVRFPDMSEPYDKALSDIIRGVAKRHKIKLREGIYCQLTGPSYETPAEIRLLQKLGVDAVGMSTAIEAIAARHAGLRVAGISCISNKAAGLSETPLSHEEVQQAADKAQPLFTRLITESVKAF